MQARPVRSRTVQLPKLTVPLPPVGGSAEGVPIDTTLWPNGTKVTRSRAGSSSL